MSIDVALLTTFRTRFEAKEPDPKNFVRRITKFDIYMTVADLVEERRAKGFAWEGIAEDFAALGVLMPVATLKTCFRRARALKRADTTPRPLRPRRLSPRPSRAARDVAPISEGQLETAQPIPDGISEPLTRALDGDSKALETTEPAHRQDMSSANGAEHRRADVVSSSAPSSLSAPMKPASPVRGGRDKGAGASNHRDGPAATVGGLEGSAMHPTPLQAPAVSPGGTPRGQRRPTAADPPSASFPIQLEIPLAEL
jgi:hypothetical protein